MSDVAEFAVSALEGAASTEGCVEVCEMGLQGMITLRADLSNKTVKAAVKALTQVVVPKPRRVAMKNGAGVAWMSPDELLIMLPYTKAPEAAAALTKALSGTGLMTKASPTTGSTFSVGSSGMAGLLGSELMVTTP